MLKRLLISSVLLTALLASPGAADAADTVVVPGVAARQLTALDGNVVWVSGAFPKQTLMRRDIEGTVAPVQGATTATYRSIDLGHDGNGQLVLTYLRCAGTKSCVAISDDLAGHRTSYKHLVPARCELTAAPSRWGSRVAYGLSCDKLHGKQHVHDTTRSGLFVRKNSAAPKRLRLPKDAVKFNVDNVSRVDLRGTIVGAAVSDIYSYAFAQTVNGSNLRSFFAAGSEGDSDEHVVGQSVGAGGVLWTLVDASHAGDPNLAVISRLQSGTCADYERLASPEENEGYRAEGLAVDASTLYLYVPGTGIVTHTFTPTFTCS
jgi:hypothetical protein